MPRAHLVEAQQLGDAEGPGADKQDQPAASKCQPQRLACKVIIDAPDLGANWLPKQDQREKRQVGRVHIDAPLECLGHAAHDALLEPWSRHHRMLQAEQGY